MKTKRITALLLAVMLLTTAACQGEAAQEEGGASTGEERQQEETPQKDGEGDSGEGNTEVSGTVTMSHWMSGGTMEKISVNTVLEQFQKDYPKVKVNVNFISGDYSTKMYANLAAGKETDVFMVPDADFGKWAKAGVLEDLTPYLEKSETVDFSKMWESASERYSWDGQQVGEGDIYAIPKDISPRVLFYNKDILAKYNVPEPDKTTPMSYDEFIEFLKKVTDADAGIYGLPQLNWEGMVRSHGTSLLAEDCKSSNLDDPKVIEAFQKVSDMIHVHHVMPTSAELGSANAMIMFQSQRAACFDGAMYDVASAREFDFQWDVCPLPAWSEDSYNSGYTGSVGYGISKNCENKDLAFLVAEYFAGEKAQSILTTIGFNIPLYQDQANSQLFLREDTVPANKEVFIQAAEHQVPLDTVYTEDDQWYTVLGSRLQPLWNDPTVKAAELLPSVKPEIDRLLQ